jgi:hypothetical protein
MTARKRKPITAMKTTPFLLKVLVAVQRCVDARGTAPPAWVARRVFPPDHPGWKRICKCGPKGSTRGSGLRMFMGGYLGKLRNLDEPLIHGFRDRTNADVRRPRTPEGNETVAVARGGGFMSNNGGGARWHLMDWAVCPRCKLRKHVGVLQVAENGGVCRNRTKCDERIARARRKKDKAAADKLVRRSKAQWNGFD